MDQVARLSKDNKVLSDRLKELAAKYDRQRKLLNFEESEEQCLTIGEKERQIDPMLSLLKRMMRSAIEQSSKQKRGRRYKDRVLLDFALNMWIFGGRLVYEALHDNLPAVFPSPSVVQSKLTKYNSSCMSGTVEYKQFLFLYILFNFTFNNNSRFSSLLLRHNISRFAVAINQNK